MSPFFAGSICKLSAGSFAFLSDFSWDWLFIGVSFGEGPGKWAEEVWNLVWVSCLKTPLHQICDFLCTWMLLSLRIFGPCCSQQSPLSHRLSGKQQTWSSQPPPARFPPILHISQLPQTSSRSQTMVMMEPVIATFGTNFAVVLSEADGPRQRRSY